MVTMRLMVKFFTGLTGLGPIFVANSCGSCHPGALGSLSRNGCNGGMSTNEVPGDAGQAGPAALTASEAGDGVHPDGHAVVLPHIGC